jgi:hypothetical protein
MQNNFKEILIESIKETIYEQEEYFCNEKEFQFFLARKLQKYLSEADIIIEFNEMNFKTDDYIEYFRKKNGFNSFDIGIKLNTKYYPIEIKYSGYKDNKSKEDFGSSIELILSDKNPDNLTADVKKIENIIGKSDNGYFIFLTTHQDWLKDKINKKISEQKYDYEFKYYYAESKTKIKYRYLIIEIK